MRFVQKSVDYYNHVMYKYIHNLFKYIYTYIILYCTCNVSISHLVHEHTCIWMIVYWYSIMLSLLFLINCLEGL